MTEFRKFQSWRWVYDILPLILYMGLIFWLSSRSVLIEVEDPANQKLLHKTAHVMAYAGLAWLWWRALSKERRRDWPVLLMAFVLTVLYGISDEIHQLFVPGRHGRAADVLFDAGGAALMILLIRRLR